MDARTATLRKNLYPLTGDFLAGRLRRNLSGSDLAHFEQLVEAQAKHPNGTRLVERGAMTDHCIILVEGFAFCTIESVGQRYITAIHVPGDFIDLSAFALKRLDHNVETAGPVMVGRVGHDALDNLMQKRSGIARAIWCATLLDAVIHRKWIQRLEELDAPRQIAHFYSELRTRLELTGRNTQGVLRTPFTQCDIADMCGISPVHSNRAVGRLKQLGLAEIRRGDVHTNDWKALADYALFDPDYLYDAGWPPL